MCPNGGHHDRSFTDRTGHPLDRSSAHITHRKDPWAGRLIGARGALFHACDNKTAGVQIDQTRQPGGIGRSPHHNEKGLGVQIPFHARGTVANGNRFQRVFTRQAHHPCLRVDGHVGMALQALQKIIRHGRRQRRTAHKHMHMLCATGQEHRRLTRRIATTHNGHFGALAITRLDIRGRIINAAALKTFQTFNGQAAVLHAGRHDQCLGRHPIATIQLNMKKLLGTLLQRGGTHGHRKAGAELHRLHFAAPDQVAARNARGKAHVILDPA
mmetsp:Transcript_337/g.966  ORF Transcript_337/g.966 Transcript_337/m.966 type:complete len:270 (-) Transcript_337:1380-2189(-)